MSKRAGLLLDPGAKGWSQALLDKRRTRRGNAEVDAEIAVHGPGLGECSVFPPRDRLEGDPQVFRQLALAQAQLLTILADLAGQERGKLLAQGAANLRVGIVVEDYLATGVTPRHSKPRHLDGVKSSFVLDLRRMMHGRRRPGRGTLFVLTTA